MISINFYHNNNIQIIKYLLLLIATTAKTAEAHDVVYSVIPSLSQSLYDGNQCYSTSSTSECANNRLTLSQLVHNSSNIFTKDTRLMFSPGIHSLELELVVENIHSFYMFAWPPSSSKTVIVCSANARFAIRNISIVTISGLEFVGCFKNHVSSVARFQIENSQFFGRGHSSQPLDTGIVAVLRIEESFASINRVGFISTTLTSMPQNLPESCVNVTNSTRARVIGLALNRSNTRITQSWFEGNNVGLGALIHESGHNYVTIIDTTFVNNSATSISNCNITGAIVYANNQSMMEFHDSKFVENAGGIIFADHNSSVLITHAEFINNEYAGHFAAVFVTDSDAGLSIRQTNFINNSGSVLHVRKTNLSLSHCEFIDNQNGHTTVSVRDGALTRIHHTKFINNSGRGVVQADHSSNISISLSELIDNESGFATIHILNGMVTSIHHSKFYNNRGGSWLLGVSNTTMINITHNEFTDNVVTYQMLYLKGIIVSLSLNEFTGNRVQFTDVFNLTSSLVHIDGFQLTLILSQFINNRAGRTIVYIRYLTNSENLTNNVFTGNNAAYEVFISSDCRPDLGLSLYSSRCIQCSENWRQNLVGIVAAASISGIVLVVFMFALNMTVAVGTLSGILFYANIVAANAETYFLPFTTPNFLTVFISWLNLDMGFDVCFFANNNSEINYTALYKTLVQLAFPAYIIILVVIVVVASECSSKFAKLVGKGNPIAVLATMILLSYAKFFNAILTSFSLFYLLSGYGSRNVDVTRLGNVLTAIEDRQLNAITYFLLIISVLILLFCVIYAIVVFSWQWLLRYEDKAICKWARYQKLRHFLEPYHAPYAAKYRYWTGLLLFVRVLLDLISLLNVSLDPRVDLMATIFVIGALILLKGMIAKRIYKNWPLDVMETAIYFNLVAFSVLTWYNLDFGGSQVAVAYISVMIIFILLLGVTIFHVLRYTRLYKCSIVEQALNWTSSKLLEKKLKQDAPSDAPEELDGYQLERPAATGDQELSTVTYSIIEIDQSCEEQEEENNVK